MGVGTDRAFLPAFAVEALDRAARYSIARTGQISALTTEDLVASADGMQSHLDLMLSASEGDREVTIEQLIAKASSVGVDGTKVVRTGYEDEPDPFATLVAESVGNGQRPLKDPTQGHPRRTQRDAKGKITSMVLPLARSR
jgi:hypothetical protein